MNISCEYAQLTRIGVVTNHTSEGVPEDDEEYDEDEEEEEEEDEVSGKEGKEETRQRRKGKKWRKCRAVTRKEGMRATWGEREKETDSRRKWRRIRGTGEHEDSGHGRRKG